MYTYSSSFCQDGPGAADSVSATTDFEAVFHALARGVTVAGAIPVVLLQVC